MLPATAGSHLAQPSNLFTVPGTHVIASIGHLIAMFSSSINNPPIHCSWKALPMPPPTNIKGRPHFHPIDWLCVCALGATACLPCRWEPGSVSGSGDWVHEVGDFGSSVRDDGTGQSLLTGCLQQTSGR